MVCHSEQPKVTTAARNTEISGKSQPCTKVTTKTAQSHGTPLPDKTKSKRHNYDKQCSALAMEANNCQTTIKNKGSTNCAAPWNTNEYVCGNLNTKDSEFTVCCCESWSILSNIGHTTYTLLHGTPNEMQQEKLANQMPERYTFIDAVFRKQPSGGKPSPRKLKS